MVSGVDIYLHRHCHAGAWQYLYGAGLVFKFPVKIGDTLTATLTVKQKLEKRKSVVIDCQVRNQDGKLVVCGDAKVIPPSLSAEIEVPKLPLIQIDGLDRKSVV